MSHFIFCVLFYSQKLLRSPRKPTRKISKIPFKVLDAPELQDDFYLNLVDWSSLNVLSVGLGTCVYLWSACTSQVCCRYSCCFSVNSIFADFLSACPGHPPVWSVCWRRFCDVCGLVREGEFLDFPYCYCVNEMNRKLHHTKALSNCG